MAASAFASVYATSASVSAASPPPLLLPHHRFPPPLLFTSRRRRRLLLSASSSDLQSSTPLQLRDVPGSYGPPLLGVASDRLKYFVTEGRDAFFRNLMLRHNSTVIRVNMPPGPPLFPDSRTIMLLDQKSLRVLFDTSKVEKRDVFAGTYMPSTEFTGGFRVLPYLDPSEEKHALLKAFCVDILREKGRRWLPEFEAAFQEAAGGWEREMGEDGEAELAASCQKMTLKFLLRSVLDADPEAAEAGLGSEATTLIQAWLAPQLAPQTNLGLPLPIDQLLHLIPIPFHFVAQPYSKLYNFFRRHSAPLLDLAHHRYGLDREEACHNLLFFLCFNTWGGFLLFFPCLLRRIADAGLALQKDLASEVRAAVADDGGEITMRGLQKMELVKATVYEVLRIDPPVPFLYGRAKEDMVVESHDAAYRVRKGELLGGYQKIAMRDPKVFDSPDSFRPARFMGEHGKKLLECLTWSNGPENQEPTLENKQCPGKDFVNLVARLLVAHIFLRYDFIKLSPQTTAGEGQSAATAPLKLAAFKKRRLPSQ